jgi:hypothetical protein
MEGASQNPRKIVRQERKVSGMKPYLRPKFRNRHGHLLQRDLVTLRPIAAAVYRAPFRGWLHPDHSAKPYPSPTLERPVTAVFAMANGEDMGRG